MNGKVEAAVVGSVLMGIATNGVYSFLSDRMSSWTIWLSVALIGGIAFWYLLRVAMAAVRALRRGRYSVLVFVLDGEQRLLLIKHPFHQVYLPPGGRLGPAEPPHAGVERVLREEAGLVQFEFDRRFHDPIVQLSERVEQLPRPAAIQLERRSQRTWVSFHCAMVYICRPTREPFVPAASLELQPRWLNIEEIRALPREERPFDDVVRRYETLIGRVT
jgi:ADP-ribose pyrophosphatase YjhB (NUDIX family)